MFKSLLSSLDRYEEASEAGDCYERVYAIWNYGQVLSKQDATRLEGRDYIDKANRLFAVYPKHAERRLGYFCPVVAVDDFVPR